MDNLSKQIIAEMANVEEASVISYDATIRLVLWP